MQNDYERNRNVPICGYYYTTIAIKLVMNMMTTTTSKPEWMEYKKNSKLHKHSLEFESVFISLQF